MYLVLLPPLLVFALTLHEKGILFALLMGILIPVSGFLFYFFVSMLGVMIQALVLGKLVRVITKNNVILNSDYYLPLNGILIVLLSRYVANFLHLSLFTLGVFLTCFSIYSIIMLLDRIRTQMTYRVPPTICEFLILATAALIFLFAN